MEHISLYKRKRSPNWQLQFTDATGKVVQESTGCKSKPEALKWLAGKKEDEAKVVDKSKCVSVFKEKFLANVEGDRAVGTVWLYRKAIDTFIMAVGDIALLDITPEHLATWKKELRTMKSPHGKTFSPTYANILYRSLSVVFHTARTWKQMVLNPFEDSEAPSVPKLPPMFLTVPEAQRLIECSGKEMKDFVEFGINSGCRRGEIINLRWRDVHLKEKYVLVRNTPTFRTKNEQDRPVPINKALKEVILRRKSVADGEYVFHLKGKQMKGQSVYQAFKRAVVRAKLDGNLHPHSLRHSCASLLVQNGASLTAVKDILGHSSISVTQIYTHNTAESLQAEIKKMPHI